MDVSGLPRYAIISGEVGDAYDVKLYIPNDVKVEGQNVVGGEGMDLWNQR